MRPIQFMGTRLIPIPPKRDPEGEPLCDGCFFADKHSACWETPCWEAGPGPRGTDVIWIEEA